MRSEPGLLRGLQRLVLNDGREVHRAEGLRAARAAVQLGGGVAPKAATTSAPIGVLLALLALAFGCALRRGRGGNHAMAVWAAHLTPRAGGAHGSTVPISGNNSHMNMAVNGIGCGKRRTRSTTGCIASAQPGKS